MHSVASPDGTRIAFQRSGAGRPLVLVHGGTADRTRWSPVLPLLEQHFTVYAMDRRGRGDSRDVAPYAIEREFEDIASLIDSVDGGDKVDVVAHSFGALCALEAARLTTRIGRLVLYEPAPPGFHESEAVLARMRQQLEADDREGLLSTFLRQAAGLSEAELELMRSVPAWQGRVAAAHTILRELEGLAAIPPFEPQRFERVETPTMLLLGGNTRGAYRETIEQIHAMLPNSQVVELPGQLHVAINTAPDLFVREVLGFLSP